MYTNYLPEGSIPKYEKDDIYYKTTNLNFIREKDIILGKKYHRIRQVRGTGEVKYKYIEVEESPVKSREQMEQMIVELQKKLKKMANENYKFQEKLECIKHNEECDRYAEKMRDGGA